MSGIRAERASDDLVVAQGKRFDELLERARGLRKKVTFT
jgi:hypothetical protein